MIENRNYREHYLRVERTAEQRRKDLTIAFDEIWDLKCKYRSLKTKLWVVTAACTALAGLNLWFANHLWDCLTVVKAAGH